MAVLTYDPRKVVVIFGAKQLTGFAEDDMVIIRPNGEGFQIYVGADGEVGRSADPNMTFECEISLATSSLSNDYLSKMYNLDRRTGMGKLPLLIKDLAGSTLFSAQEAWVTNFPEAARGRTIGAQNWVLHTGQIVDPIVGGNVDNGILTGAI